MPHEPLLSRLTPRGCALGIVTRLGEPAGSGAQASRTRPRLGAPPGSNFRSRAFSFMNPRWKPLLAFRD